MSAIPAAGEELFVVRWAPLGALHDYNIDEGRRHPINNQLLVLLQVVESFHTLDAKQPDYE